MRLPYLFAAFLMLPLPAYAQLAGTDTTPGSSCAGFPTGATRVTADAANDGVQVTLICNGTTWEQEGLVAATKAGDPPTADGGGSSIWTAGTGDNIYYSSGSLPRVGIRINDPQSTLHLEGFITQELSGNLAILNAPSHVLQRARGSSGSETIVSSGDLLGTYQFNAYDGDEYLQGSTISSFIEGTPANNDIATNLIFSTREAGASLTSERMRIDTDGNVGINETNPSVALDVVGDINYTGVIVDVSDIRMKYDIHPVENSLKKLTDLNGFSFKMKDGDSAITEYGVSAQDVQRVFPELVHEVDADGTLGVSYDGLIAPMIEAMKEQQAQIEALETRINDLEARNNAPTSSQPGEL